MKKIGFKKWLFLILFFLFFYYSVFFEPNNIKVEKLTIFIKELPKSFEGTKIVQISDLHSLWFGNREKKLLKIVESLNPDFVFLTGDYVDPLTKLTDKNLNSVKKFWEILGEKYSGKIFAVFGNHDTKFVQAEILKTKIIVLDNKSRKIFKGKDFIYLVGVSDPRTGQDSISKALEDVKEDRPKILLAHAPEIIEKIKNLNFDLVLVGDTHGGQVNLPFLKNFHLTKLGRKYSKGFFKLKNTILYVNRGIGTTFFPIRFYCQPEITLIELKTSD
jgi:predicted MPP superfamily phosphohydrolase